jgi:4-amino-4-deoxy-L-arabinose transferase-like glycosyltransferase
MRDNPLLERAVRVDQQARMLQKLDQGAERLATALERYNIWLLCAFTIGYLIATCFIASRKLMWTDELFTFYGSRLPGLPQVWDWLMTGEDVTPLLFFILTRASFFLFGVNHLSIRLPETLGFWIMCLCLYRFVAVRSSALHGFVALLFPLVTGAYNYAYEARSYGIVLGFTGLSLLCWQAVARGSNRHLSLIGLGLCLAGALSSHYYAILIFFPLALGELARSVTLRRVDLPVWIVFGLSAAIPLLIFLPLIRQASRFTASFWSVPPWRLVPSSFSFLLSPSIIPLVPALILLAVYLVTDRQRPGHETHRSLPPYELAATLGFVLIPVVTLIIAKLLTNAFHERYTLPTIIGLDILLALATYYLPAGRAIVSMVLIVSLCGWFLVVGRTALMSINARSQTQEAVINSLRSEGDSSLPIVDFSIHTFMPLAYYAPQDVSARLVYLADPGESLRYFGTAIEDRLMLGLSKEWSHLRVETWRSFVSTHKRFMAHGPLNKLGWLVHQSEAANMRIELKRQYGDEGLFLVSSQEQP